MNISSLLCGKRKVLTAKALLLSVAGSLLSLSIATTVHAADLAEIEKRGYLSVATEDDYAPFNFMNNGQTDGFNKDMLDEMKKYAEFEIRQDILPWTGLLASVANGQYDAALTGASITDDRLRVFNYATPIASAQHYYIKRIDDDSIESVADLSGKAVGVQAGSAMLARLPELEKMLADQGGKLGKVVQYQSYPEAYADLANGRVDYVIDSIVPVNALIKSRPNVFAKGQPVSGGGFVGWPVPKKNTELLTYLSDFINHMKETGQLAELQQKWFGESFDDLPSEPITSVEQFHKLASLE
ncbi:transporter substrate-binding domain-containing protein [Phytohalomonas tamaricis]|uniref:transporter substrate-binding domain-containing protein n=1 Tax=Phytohalomonas tamaricis TaxID=2081032 RepID=UPI000D0AF387|nr:transporter substrate-binding domain-containing protein [Phytohalomonas tamaricis]